MDRYANLQREQQQSQQDYLSIVEKNTSKGREVEMLRSQLQTLDNMRGAWMSERDGLLAAVARLESENKELATSSRHHLQSEDLIDQLEQEKVALGQQVENLKGQLETSKSIVTMLEKQKEMVCLQSHKPDELECQRNRSSRNSLGDQADKMRSSSIQKSSASRNKKAEQLNHLILQSPMQQDAQVYNNRSIRDKSSSKSTSHFNSKYYNSKHQEKNKENLPPFHSHYRKHAQDSEENYNSDIQYLSYAVKFNQIDSHRSLLTDKRDDDNLQTTLFHASHSNPPHKHQLSPQDYTSLSGAANLPLGALHRSVNIAEESKQIRIESPLLDKRAERSGKFDRKLSKEQDTNKTKVTRMVQTLRRLVSTYEEQLKPMSISKSLQSSEIEQLGPPYVEVSKQEVDVSVLKLTIKQLWNEISSSEPDQPEGVSHAIISEVLSVLPKLLNLIDSLSTSLSTSKQACKKLQETHRKSQGLQKMHLSFWNSLGIDKAVLNKRIERFVRQRRAVNLIARHFRAYRRDKEKFKLKRIHQTNHAMFQAGSGKYLLQALMQRSEDYFVQMFSKLRPEHQSAKDTVSEKRADALKRLTLLSK